MDVFKTISEKITGMVKTHKTPEAIDKNEILNLIDNNMIALKVVTDTYDANADLFTFIQTDLLTTFKDNAMMQTYYRAYQSGLNSIAKQQENNGLLKSLSTAATLVMADHVQMRDQFVSLFNDGTDVGDITLEQMKLSHAMLLGFINLSNLLTDWFCFFVGSLHGQTTTGVRFPPYRETMVRDSTATVADFVNDVLLRGTSRNIITVVKSIRKIGDVALYTKAATLDTYANINDYPGLSRFMRSFSPILFIRETLGSISHWFYRRNLTLRDWMLAKTMVLRMDMQKIDPNAPEYQKQQQIVQRYSDLLATLDKQISAYEKA
jgi:hypothetical protein